MERLTSYIRYYLLESPEHMVVAITRMEHGLAGQWRTWLADVSQATCVIKSVIYTLQILLGNGAQSVWVIILPSMMWCSSAVTAFSLVYNFSQGSATRPTGKFAKVTGQMGIAFLASTLSHSDGASTYETLNEDRPARWFVWGHVYIPGFHLYSIVPYLDDYVGHMV
ncbi:hypothetical protein DFJ58DRAFT_915109 [Suillus subalutaceus]|uniref:uncharacterized protein n=1 Tax=Suillus subalutaceus TaxID=48586 RepID=UPI001B8791CA|nr:uncharacterized protein DFJ58DRAFT_915109 [Suillus subalutaceus]KAG1847823.1 hypothetical protein DFJ58DRAFT_915109 [Suillus subalutaceus]